MPPTGEIQQAMVIRLAHGLPPGCRQWLLHGPDPLWNNGAHAAVYWALRRRGLINDLGGLTEVGKQVQTYLCRGRGRCL